MDDVENVLNKNQVADVRLWASPMHLTPTTLMPQFYRMADGVILLFSPHDETTIDNLWTWYDQSKAHVSENVPFIFMATNLSEDEKKLKRRNTEQKSKSN